MLQSVESIGMAYPSYTTLYFCTHLNNDNNWKILDLLLPLLFHLCLAQLRSLSCQSVHFTILTWSNPHILDSTWPTELGPKQNLTYFRHQTTWFKYTINCRIIASHMFKQSYKLVLHVLPHFKKFIRSTECVWPPISFIQYFAFIYLFLNISSFASTIEHVKGCIDWHLPIEAHFLIVVANDIFYWRSRYLLTLIGP